MTGPKLAAAAAAAMALLSLSAAAAARAQTPPAVEAPPPQEGAYRPCPSGTSHIRLVMAMDRSGSLAAADPGGGNRRAAVEKLRQALAEKAESPTLSIQVALLAFDHESHLLMGFRPVSASVPSDRLIGEAVQDGIGDTDYGPAMREALRLFGVPPDGADITCDLLVWFTDGILDPLNTVARFGGRPAGSGGEVAAAAGRVDALIEDTCLPGGSVYDGLAGLDLQTYALLLGDAFADTDVSTHRGWMTDRSLRWIETLTNDPESALTSDIEPVCGDGQSGETLDDEQRGVVIDLDNVAALTDAIEDIPAWVTPPSLTCAESEKAYAEQSIDDGPWSASTPPVCRVDYYDGADPAQREPLGPSGFSVGDCETDPGPQAELRWRVDIDGDEIRLTADLSGIDWRGPVADCAAITWWAQSDGPHEIEITADLWDVSESAPLHVQCSDPPEMETDGSGPPVGMVKVKTGCRATVPAVGRVTGAVSGEIELPGGESAQWTGAFDVGPDDDGHEISAEADLFHVSVVGQDTPMALESEIVIDAQWNVAGRPEPRDDSPPESPIHWAGSFDPPKALVDCRADPSVDGYGEESPGGPVVADTGCFVLVPPEGTVTVTVSGELGLPDSGGRARWESAEAPIVLGAEDDEERPIIAVTDTDAVGGTEQVAEISIDARWEIEGRAPRDDSPAGPIMVPVLFLRASNKAWAALMTAAALAAAAAVTYLCWRLILGRRCRMDSAMRVWQQQFDVHVNDEGAAAAPSLDGSEIWEKTTRPANVSGRGSKLVLGPEAEVAVIRPAGPRRMFSPHKLARVVPGPSGEGWSFRASRPAGGDGAFHLPGPGDGVVVMGVKSGGGAGAGRVWGLQGRHAQTDAVAKRARLPEMFRRLSASVGSAGEGEEPEPGDIPNPGPAGTAPAVRTRAGRTAAGGEAEDRPGPDDGLGRDGPRRGGGQQPEEDRRPPPVRKRSRPSSPQKPA